MMRFFPQKRHVAATPIFWFHPPGCVPTAAKRRLYGTMAAGSSIAGLAADQNLGASGGAAKILRKARWVGRKATSQSKPTSRMR